MESSFVTYYDFLELPESASKEEVLAAYRSLAKEFHPDCLLVIPDHLKRVRKAAEEKWYEIQEAWSVLGDPIKRRRYDEMLKARRDQSPAAAEP